MAWIELHDTLPDHKKVLDVAEALKMDKDLVVGKLVRLWTWALNNREDGTFKAHDISTIAEVMRFKGRPQRLIDALIGAKLLDQVGAGYIIHDWEERVGMLLAKREAIRSQTRERVRKYRKQKNRRDCGRENNNGNALQNRCVTLEKDESNAATVPYHTLPYIDDDDEDEEDVYISRAREADTGTDMRDDGYKEASRIVQAAYSAAYGHPPTKAEVEHLSRIAVLGGKTALIGEAIQRAAAHGARSVPAYVDEIVKEWQYQAIDTQEELATFDYLQDCMRGKITTALDPEQAYDRMRAHRERKREGMDHVEKSKKVAANPMRG